jgi:hypothetical protein
LLGRLVVVLVVVVVVGEEVVAIVVRGGNGVGRGDKTAACRSGAFAVKDVVAMVSRGWEFGTTEGPPPPSGQLGAAAAAAMAASCLVLLLLLVVVLLELPGEGLSGEWSFKIWSTTTDLFICFGSLVFVLLLLLVLVLLPVVVNAAVAAVAVVNCRSLNCALRASTTTTVAAVNGGACSGSTASTVAAAFFVPWRDSIFGTAAVSLNTTRSGTKLEVCLAVPIPVGSCCCGCSSSADCTKSPATTALSMVELLLATVLFAAVLLA